VTRLDRNLRRSPGEKSLGPIVGSANRDMNPFTARDADLDLLVLEGIPAVNLGRGVPDPTPGGTQELAKPSRARSALLARDDGSAVAARGNEFSFSEKDPFNMSNPEGFFPGSYGPSWKYRNLQALGVVPRSRRAITPVSLNKVPEVEWTEDYHDAIRDETGVWHVPPPPEMEVERAVYDALKREIIEVGGYAAPFPRHPRPEDYEAEDMGWMDFTRRKLKPARLGPFVGDGATWRDGDPLYHAMPTFSLPKVVVEGLTAGDGKPLFFGTTPTAWNDFFPSWKSDISLLRISPTDRMNVTLNQLAAARNSVPDSHHTIIDVNGERMASEQLQDLSTQDGRSAFSRYAEVGFFNTIVPASDIEVMNQTGEWIPLLNADLEIASTARSGGGAEAGMSNEKSRGIRRLLAKLTDGRFGKTERDDAPAERPAPVPRENAPTVSASPVPPSRIRYSDSYGGDDLIKDEQRIERMNHEDLVSSGSWDRIHSDHYDWWAYPIDRGSTAYGETFNVAGEPLKRLRRDPEFLASLAREIEIQALALGWSLYDANFLEQIDWEKGQDWRKAYPIRLWKATRSAQIFGLEEEFESMLMLQRSLKDAGVKFNNVDYWNDPGTINDVPSLGPSWQERQQTQRFTASDATGQYSLFPTESRFDRRGAASGPTSPEVTRRRPETGDDLFADRPEEWPGLAYDSDDSSMQVVYGVVIAAEELADLLFESDRTMEFGYPYERIDEDTRSMMAEDIFFATGLLDDDQLVSDFDVDRQESAAKMREYARAIWDSVGYADDAETLEELAEALEDPTILEDDLIYQPTDLDPGASDGEAGMGRRFRGLDEEPDYSDMSLSDPEIQDFIESEFDLAEQDKIFGRSRSFLADFDKDSFVPGKPKKVYQLSIGAPENIPDQTKEDYKELWNAGVGWRDINRRLGISNEDGALVQSELLRTGVISRRSAPEGTSHSWTGELRPLTAAEERFAELLLASTPKTQIMDELGLSEREYRNVARFLYQRGISRGVGPAGRPRRELSDTEKEFVRLYGEGKTMPQIMAELGLSRGQYINRYQFLRRRGLVNPSRELVSQGRRPLTETEKEFVRLYRGGKAMSQIMAELGLSREEYISRYQFLRERGLFRGVASKRRGPKRLRANIDKEFVRLYMEGKTVTEVMAELGLSRREFRTIYQYLSQRGLFKDRSRQRPLTDTDNEFLRLRREGKSRSQIMDELGLSPEEYARTSAFLRGRGLVNPRRRGASQRPLTETEKEIVRLYGEGKSMRQIMAEFGLSEREYATIYGFLRGRGLFKGPDRRRNRRPLTDTDKEFLRLHGEGKTRSQIMDELGLSEREYATIYEYLRYGDLFKDHPRRRRGRRPLTDTDNEFLRLYGEGKTRSQIMDELGLSPEEYTRRYQFLRERGLVNPRRDLMPFRREFRDRQRGLSKDPNDGPGAEAGMAGDLHDSPENERLMNEAVVRFRDGERRADIADRLGIAPSRLDWLLRKARDRGLVELNRPGGRSKDPGFIESQPRFAELFNSGVSKPEIMRQMNLTHAQYMSHYDSLRRRGLREPFGRRDARLDPELTESAERFAEMYNWGASKTEIMRAMGLTPNQYKRLFSASQTRALIVTSHRRERKLTEALGGEAGMSSALVRKVTDDDAQLNLIYSVPGVRTSVVMRNTEGVPTVPGRNAIMKPYLLAPHVSIDHLAPDNPAIRSLAPALGRAGLGSYPVEGHKVPKIQGPVVRDFADELIGPKAVADAISGTFPTADELLTAYAVNALIRARAEYLSDSVLNADKVNEAILFGNAMALGGNLLKGLWEKSQIGRSLHLDPFSYFGDDSNFLKAVIDALPEQVRSGLAFSPAEERIPGVIYEDRSWGDTSHFESIIIREDDDLSRRFAPMVRRQAAIVVDHARRHGELAKKWAQTAYDLMREAGLTDAEVAFVVNEHWTKASRFKLATVQPGSVLGHAARLGVKAFSSRYSPISRGRKYDDESEGFREEEDFGLHEFFHHYLGQGFTRHGEYVAFRGPADLIDSYHGHLQWAFNQDYQLGMFASKILLEGLGADTKNKSSTLDNYSSELFESVARAIYDRLQEMLASPDARARLLGQVFPEFVGVSTADELRIEELIRNQFRNSSRRFNVSLTQYVPVMQLMTVHDFLVPREYWPYGGESKILFGGDA